uniref:ATP-binding cassette transporter subfamily H member-like2 protein n=1 Tax=Brachionus koreanus TaxID=1199090 RepID=A0A1J0MMZ5_9BILA|nr:ATP-binding cassette transporter subfamily H member -like2 protein [Brachionus koreanus]
MTLDTGPYDFEQTLIKQSNLDAQSPDYALQALNLTKVFHSGTNIFNKSKTAVLNQVNINIEKNKIYALLGPSGCGKTTLLKCLLGLLDYEHGKVLVNQDNLSKKKKNKVNLSELGYMPQETCLYSELSVGELFYYFGKLYSMSFKEIKKREKFLISLLNLPNSKHLIANMSGGQARRTSLAVSLLNNPKILVLDEPTVGLDPMLRRKIWNFLEDLAHRDKTTILITTHYIEEARGADCLGFMRSGKIIEENSPEFLIKKFNTQILEDVFYHICENQAKDLTNSEDLINVKQTNYLSTKKTMPIDLSDGDQDYKSSVEKKKLILSFDRTVANIYKDSLKCIRNKKPVKNLPVGFVNYDNSSFNLSGQIVDEMDSQILNKKFYKNFDSGYQELKLGKIWTLFVIDQNFGQQVLEFYLKKKDFKDLNNILHVYMDNTNQQISLAIKNVLFDSVKKVADRLIWTKRSRSNSKMNNSNVDNFYFFKFEQPVYGEREAVFTNFMAPGIALSVIFFISVASTASNFEFEKRVGLTERAHISGVRTIELLLSQLIVYSILMAIQVFIILGLLFGFFKLPLKGSFFLLIGLLLSQGFCGLSYGLSLASVFYGEETVIQVTLASFYPILLMSGIIWPIEAQPTWLSNYISKLLPLTYATDSFRAILEKDWNIGNEKVFKGFLVTYAWTVLFLIVFLVMFSHKSKLTFK